MASNSDPWVPMQRATRVAPPSEDLVRATMAAYDKDRDGALELLKEDLAKVSYWVNDLYQVEVRPSVENFVQLNIRRRDGKVIFRDWRHFQRIKNEIVGPECEGIELYPAESRLVDSSNKYHVWVCTDPTFRFPIGWGERDVSYESGAGRGMKQRGRTV